MAGSRFELHPRAGAHLWRRFLFMSARTGSRYRDFLWKWTDSWILDHPGHIAEWNASVECGSDRAICMQSAILKSKDIHQGILTKQRCNEEVSTQKSGIKFSRKHFGSSPDCKALEKSRKRIHKIIGNKDKGIDLFNLFKVWMVHETCAWCTIERELSKLPQIQVPIKFRLVAWTRINRCRPHLTNNASSYKIVGLINICSVPWLIEHESIKFIECWMLQMSRVITCKYLLLRISGQV